jgi:hypothetical protein
VQAEPKLHDGVDPIPEHSHTLLSVQHLAVVKDDFVITWLNSVTPRNKTLELPEAPEATVHDQLC